MKGGVYARPVSRCAYAGAVSRGAYARSVFSHRLRSWTGSLSLSSSGSHIDGSCGPSACLHVGDAAAHLAQVGPVFSLDVCGHESNIVLVAFKSARQRPLHQLEAAVRWKLQLSAEGATHVEVPMRDSMRANAESFKVYAC